MRVCSIAGMPRRLVLHGSALILATFAFGCHGTSQAKRAEPVATTASADGTVVQARKVLEPPTPPGFRGAGDLNAAEDLYLVGQWKKAAKLFGKVADDKKNPALFAEKARYYEAECKLQQAEYTDAMATFNRLLIDFQYGVFREKAVGRMYEIANFWLDDTRMQFALEQEKAEGKRSYVPWNYLHFDKRKPLLDEEGHALKMLEQVYYNDPTGPHAERALFAAGYVHFRRGNFREADQILTAMIENIDRQNKKSEFRDRALELAILAKNNCSGGPLYDARKPGEALKLIQEARMTSPELVAKRGDFLDNQVKIIGYMQAEKELETAKFYDRTGHPAAAWFSYELVRRHYAGTEFHDKALARMKEISGDLAAHKDQSEFAKATRRDLNKLVSGHEVPTLAANATMPTIPGELPAAAANPIVPVGDRQAVPNTTVPPRNLSDSIMPPK